MQELVDPNVPTFALGSSLDELLFAPGYYIPSTFLPQAEDGLRGGGALAGWSWTIRI